MRVSFEDDRLRRLYEEPDFILPRLGPDVTKAFRRTVALVAHARSEPELRSLRALRFKKLQGDRRGQHSMRLNRQWRLIIRLEADADGRVVVVVELVDYH